MGDPGGVVQLEESAVTLKRPAFKNALFKIAIWLDPRKQGKSQGVPCAMLCKKV